MSCLHPGRPTDVWPISSGRSSRWRARPSSTAWPSTKSRSSSRNPDSVVGADAAFIATRSLPYSETSEGYLETIPELVVEVRSKDDRVSEIEAKVRKYLQAGVLVVWDADPKARTVTAHRLGLPPQVFTAADELTAPEVIPTFRVSVARLFPT